MTKRLRVLFITPWYPNRQNSVQGIFVCEHAKAVQIYDDVVVLHRAGHGEEARSLWNVQQHACHEPMKELARTTAWICKNPRRYRPKVTEVELNRS